MAVLLLRFPHSNPGKHFNANFDAVMYIFLDPAAALLAVYYAFVFGVLYLVIVTVSSIFNEDIPNY